MYAGKFVIENTAIKLHKYRGSLLQGKFSVE